VIGTGKKAKVIEEYDVDTGLRHLRALEARDALEILAEPNIMAINGKQATFTYISRRRKYAANLCHRTAQCQQVRCRLRSTRASCPHAQRWRSARQSALDVNVNRRRYTLHTGGASMPISKIAAAVFTLSLPAAMSIPALGQTLEGTIDMHAHSDPDGTPRKIDAIDLAKLAKSHGMRAIVLKNHYEPTASLAYIVRKEVPDIEVFGGVTMDLTNGGVNPAAVEWMSKAKGGYGKVVWMPTSTPNIRSRNPSKTGPSRAFPKTESSRRKWCR
jgi:hypothetical protein